MRLINADALTEKCGDWYVEEGTEEGFIGTVKSLLDGQPSVHPDPCEDAVSRKAVLSMIDTYMNKSVELHYLPTSDGIKKLISILPSAQPEQRWIPVEERLPEEGKVVLTQAKFKDDVKMAVSSRIDYNYWTTWGTRDINIIAWMPLPEPYQEGGDNE